MKKVLLFFMIFASIIAMVACGSKHTHTVTGELIVVKEATCSEMGEGYMYCSECGEIVNTIYIPKTNKHSEVVITAVESTCTSTGLTEGKECYTCGKIIVAQQEAPLKAHTEEIIPALESTCIEHGLTEGKKCSVCGDILVVQQEAPLKSHTEVIDKAVGATCTQTGLTEGKHCSVCNEILVAQQETPIIAHTYTDKYDETCNECGFVRLDAECAHKETETIKGYEATCTSAGLTDGSKCKKCGEILVSQKVISVKGHTEVIDKEVEATCTSTGLTAGKHCSVCNLVIIAQEVVAIKPHTEVADKAIEPTCTTTGLTEGKHCSVCNAVIVAQNVISAKGHNFGEWITVDEATATKEGLKERTCVCGEKETEVIPVKVSEGLTYELNDDGASYMVTGIGTCKDTEIVIPATYNGCAVTSIGDYAFGQCSNIEYITIPSGVASIGEGAFESCSALKEVIISHGVRYIGEFAFGYCKSLTSIVLPDSIVTIAEKVFYHCDSLEEVVMSSNIERIGEYAFQYCDKLIFNQYGNCKYLGNKSNPYIALLGAASQSVSNVNVYSGTKIIADKAFYQSNSLISVIIPGSVRVIGNSSFASCTALTTVTISEGVERIEDYAFYSESIKNVSIPNSLSYLGSFSFDFAAGNLIYTRYDRGIYLGNSTNRYVALIWIDNISYSSYSIHSNTRIIVGDAFMFCDKLTSITIPRNVIYIGDGIFDSCSALKNIYVASDNTAYKSVNGNLYTIDGDVLVRYAPAKTETSFIVPNDVTSIAGGAFNSCVSLKSITLPNGLTSIGDYAFVCCSNLTSIIIPPNVTSIGFAAFNVCSKLTSVRFEDAYTWYCKSTFSDLSNITGGMMTSVTNSSTNATYFTSTYSNYCWYKK